MKLKINTSFDYKKIATIAGKFLFDNRITVTALAILITVGYATYDISNLTKPEVDDKALLEQFSALDSVKFDEEAIKEIRDLNDSNVEIQPDFTNRNNPFSE